MIYFGENLGPLRLNENIPSQTRIWLGACGTFDSKETCTAMERCQWNEANKVCSALSPEFKGGCILLYILIRLFLLYLCIPIKLKQTKYIGTWKTLQVTDTQEIFVIRDVFNANISNWDASKVMAMGILVC
jgi:hypothetical protein